MQRERYSKNPGIEIAEGVFDKYAEPKAFINAALIFDTNSKAVVATLKGKSDENSEFVFFQTLFLCTCIRRPAQAAQQGWAGANMRLCDCLQRFIVKSPLVYFPRTM